MAIARGRHDTTSARLGRSHEERRPAAATTKYPSCRLGPAAAVALIASFEKKSAPGKLVTLVSGADQEVPGQTLLRVLVVDK